MKRREYLAGAAVAISALAGCSSSGEGGTPTPEPTTPEPTTQQTTTAVPTEFEVGNEEELLPDGVGEEWPDQDLVAQHDRNEDFDRAWMSSDGVIAVLMAVDIYETVEGAEESMQRRKATGNDPNDYPLADEAFIYSGEQAATFIFRDSNAIGVVVAARQDSIEVNPDRQRAVSYGKILYAEWPGIGE